MDYPYKVGFGTVSEAYKPYWNEEVHEYLIIVNNDDPLCYNSTVMGLESNHMASLTTLGYIDLDTDEHCSEKGTLLWEMRPDEYNVLYPLEVIRECRMEYFLDNLYEAYVEENHIQVFLETTTLGNLLFNKTYDRFDGMIEFKGRKIAISIAHRFNSKKLVSHMETFVRDFEVYDEEMRRYAAEKLTALANEQGDSNVTEENIYNLLIPEVIEERITNRFIVYYYCDGLIENNSIKVEYDSKGPRDPELWDDISRLYS